MATDSFIRLPPDSTGKKLYTQEHTVGVDQVQAQVMHVGSGTNPGFLQTVDARGQAFTRFAEGSPSMDAFGNLRVGTAQVIGAYEYTNGDMADLFQDALASGATATHEPATSETVFAVTSANGSSVKRTTNRYHYYQPGVGNLIIQTLHLGDSGKTNNQRGWGYVDDNNGLFWQLNGTTLQVGIRSNISGSAISTLVNQADWNVDKLDGTGVSGMVLDVTKANFYFLDFAWLGVGPVRFGILGPDGARNVCHIFQNPNNNGSAYMRTATLPLRMWNTNTGAASSGSELHAICSAVYAESRTDYTFWRFADIERSTPVTVTTDTPVLSMKVKPATRVGIYPECLCVYVTGGTVKLTIVDDAVLTNPTWAIDGEGSALGDTGATAATGGSKFKVFYVGPGVTNLPIAQFYETNDEGYHRLADDSDSYTFSLLATKLDGTTVSVGATLEYRELR